MSKVVYMTPEDLRIAKTLGDSKRADKIARFGASLKNEPWAMAGKMAFAKFLGTPGIVPEEWKVRTLARNYLIVRETDVDHRKIVLVKCRADFDYSLKHGAQYEICGWIYPPDAKKEQFECGTPEMISSWWVPKWALNKFGVSNPASLDIGGTRTSDLKLKTEWGRTSLSEASR